MKTFFGMVLLVLMVFSLSACNNKPSDAEMSASVEAALNGMIEENIGIPGFIKIAAFTKVDSRMDGDKYMVDAKYDIVMQKSANDVGKEIRSAHDMFTAAVAIEMVQEMFGNKWAVGEKMVSEEELTFVKTEKSWKLIAE